MTARFNRAGAALALGLILLAPLGVAAHEATKGPNGGPLIDMEGHHVEMVAAPNELTFYLTGDKDAPIVSAGSKMKAIVQDNGKTAQIELAAVEPNKLVAKLDKPLSPGAKVVITGSLADGHTVQAKFETP